MSESDKPIRILGTILWARYSFVPNRLKYCGPDANLELFEYATRKTGDRKLREILSEFEAAYPYIQFIAQENRIRDPFDWRVVEAYWLGNDLLDSISLDKFYWHLKKHYFKKAKTTKVFQGIVAKIPAGIKPCHAFHVLEIFQKIGSMRGINIGPVLNTINNCLIGWGKVVRVSDDFLEVEHWPLVFSKSKLIFGPRQIKKIEYKYQNKSFFDIPQIGDWVSIHWNWACDVLTPRQLKNLQKWTFWHLKLANLNSI